MSRWFYTDPLAAAWMAKHFGMRIGIIEPARRTLAASSDAVLTGGDHFIDLSVPDLLRWGLEDGGAWRLYFHPDSLPLLQPQIGDTVLNCDDDPARVVPTGQLNYGLCEAPLRHAIEYVASGAATIIQRNCVPFMWPECEP